MTSFLSTLKFLLFVCAFAAAGHILRVPDAGTRTTSLQTVLSSLDKKMAGELNLLDSSILHYQALANINTSSVEELRRAHLTTRQAYKKVEFLLAYAQPATIARHINGAPLPKTEPSVPEINVIAPSGLQTLDELVFADEIDRAAIKKLSHKLLGDYRLLHRQMKSLRLQHRHLFEGLQQQLVRSFTLGLTGFDTPSSGNALPEARVVFQTMAAYYSEYAPLVESKDSTTNALILTSLARARAMLAEGNFDSFDRLAFLRQVINPLTEALPDAQRLLNIESAGDYGDLPSPINPQADHLFDADWLNAEYYANFSSAAYSEQRQKLGKLLFFDPILSNDLTSSCASCHRPELAFTDGYAKSLSTDGKGTLQRNSPTLINSVFAEKYFHDMREEFLERQVKHVVVDAHEFATDFVTIEERIRKSDDYRQLFKEAYANQPDYALSKWSISDALSHYVASLQGMNAEFDRYARGSSDELAPEVIRGFNLFMGKAACGTCHFAPTFNGLVPPQYLESESEVLGVPDSIVWEGAKLDPDPGRIANFRPADEAYFNAYAFKTPTVRNIAITAPYMHNGVYNTLEEVMDFYNRGGGAGIGIELDHQTLPPDPLGLQEDEISDIISFMKSLTDYEDLVEVPARLPSFDEVPAWNNRPIGGTPK